MGCVRLYSHAMTRFAAPALLLSPRTCSLSHQDTSFPRFILFIPNMCTAVKESTLPLAPHIGSGRKQRRVR